MAWCQATGRYLSQFWPRSMASLGHNELRPRVSHLRVISVRYAEDINQSESTIIPHLTSSLFCTLSPPFSLCRLVLSCLVLCVFNITHLRTPQSHLVGTFALESIFNKPCVFYGECFFFTSALKHCMNIVLIRPHDRKEGPSFHSLDVIFFQYCQHLFVLPVSDVIDLLRHLTKHGHNGGPRHSQFCSSRSCGSTL